VTSSLNLRLQKGDQLWFPGLMAELLANFVLRNQVFSSLVEHYGTARWLAGNLELPAPAGGDIQVGPHVAKIEYLSSETAAGFEGLQFADARDPRIPERIQAAAHVITHVPSLPESIGSVVQSIHPLQAPRDHDVSHSTPELPFSIFVSIPERGERDTSLRVAESIIHESMHLQLTLMDSIEPMIVNEHATGYSPWKEELRPVAGLLHGLYVFAVIHQALETLMTERDDWCRYSRRRRTAIADEIALLPETPGGLSNTGAALWHECRSVVGA